MTRDSRTWSAASASRNSRSPGSLPFLGIRLRQRLEFQPDSDLPFTLGEGCRPNRVFRSAEVCDEPAPGYPNCSRRTRTSSPVRVSKHIDRIVMRPTTGGDSKHYVAEGDWNLLGKYEGRPGAALRNLEMVPGVRFELTTFGLSAEMKSMPVFASQ